MDRSYIKRVKRLDKFARYAITLGGVFVILSVIAILLMIARVTVPLFVSPSADVIATYPLPASASLAEPLALGLDETQAVSFILDASGKLHFFDLVTGRLREVHSLVPASRQASTIASVQVQPNNVLSLLWNDGSLSVDQVSFRQIYTADNQRQVATSVLRKATLDADATGTLPRQSVARVLEDGLLRVSLMPDNKLHLTRLVSTTDFLGETASELKTSTIADPLPAPVTALTMDQAGKTLYAGTEGGHILYWDLAADPPRLMDTVDAVTPPRPITALQMVLGDISLAVGDAGGGLSTWFAVNTSERGGLASLRRIHQLQPHPAPVAAIMPSQRDKTIVSLSRAGEIHFDHMTSERHLLTLKTTAPLQLFAITPRGNGLLALDARGQAVAWNIDNPHPEVSWKTLFGKVWYEHYREPAHVWQSSSASDDFEPKFSLTPLIFGTLKGTFYAMLFALPLSIGGAIYTSQFMRPGLRRIVKPTIEIMAALPSVVLGFITGLWLAPRVETSIVALFLAVVLVPALLMIVLLFWQRLESRPAFKRISRGYEFLLLVPVLVLGVQLAFIFGPLVEQHLLGKPFPQWLYDTLHARYDQRNNIIIAFGLGFAVIPIIFTIADDALSNVPRSLTAASLALGASRWQTAWRVVLPSASPGIFAGAMIGFGRAVGETMIVLMATGNTPTMDWSIFNGMRTLSANIAVEIPEAPVGGSLYRILFLTAVILFLLTFILNTVAEIVRQRLRKRYGQL